MTDSDIDRLWTDAVKKHLANMPPEDIAELLADIQPKTTAAVEKPVTSSRAQQIRAAEETGDLATAFAVKAAWISNLMNPTTEPKD